MAKLGGGEAKVTNWLDFGQNFPGDKNGYAVFGGRSEGLRGRKLSQKCRSCGPAVDAEFAPTLLWRFRLPVRTSALPLGCLTAFRRAGLNARGSCRKLPSARCSSHPARRRHIHPIKATVATETPSGMDRNINGILGIYSQGVNLVTPDWVRVVESLARVKMVRGTSHRQGSCVYQLDVVFLLKFTAMP